MWKPKLPTTYAEQTHASPYRLIRYAHRRRHTKAVELILEAKPRTLLDYGAGDGFLVGELLKHDIPWLDQVILYEPMEKMRSVLERDLATWVASGKVEILHSRPSLEQLTIDMVLCMGVLEHLPLPERDLFYEICEQRLAPMGSCIVDVPVEIGPTVLIKELGRVAVKGRSPEYSPTALIKTALGLPIHDHERFDPSNMDTFIHYHTGFDYRRLYQELSSRFDVELAIPTPFPRLPPWLGNQEVFFIMRLKRKPIDQAQG